MVESEPRSLVFMHLCERRAKSTKVGRSRPSTVDEIQMQFVFSDGVNARNVQVQILDSHTKQLESPSLAKKTIRARNWILFNENL